MIFLYIAESVAPSGRLIRKYTFDYEKAAKLSGKLTARSITRIYGQKRMHNGWKKV